MCMHVHGKVPVTVGGRGQNVMSIMQPVFPIAYNSLPAIARNDGWIYKIVSRYTHPFMRGLRASAWKSTNTPK